MSSLERDAQPAYVRPTPSRRSRTQARTSLDEIGRDIRKGRSPEDVNGHATDDWSSPTTYAGDYGNGLPGAHANGYASDFAVDAPPRRQTEPRADHLPEPALPAGYYREDASGARAMETERQRGLPGWAAILVLLAIAAIGGIIDMATGTTVRGGFNIGFVIACVVAILIVRRRAMFTVVVAPPLVYALASGLILYLRSGGLSNHKVLLDGAVNWLVYGFPAIAIATAAVLIIAGIRSIIRR